MRILGTKEVDLEIVASDLFQVVDGKIMFKMSREMYSMGFCTPSSQYLFSLAVEMLTVEQLDMMNEFVAKYRDTLSEEANLSWQDANK